MATRQFIVAVVGVLDNFEKARGGHFVFPFVVGHWPLADAS